MISNRVPFLPIFFVLLLSMIVCSSTLAGEGPNPGISSASEPSSPNNELRQRLVAFFEAQDLLTLTPYGAQFGDITHTLEGESHPSERHQRWALEILTLRENAELAAAPDLLQEIRVEDFLNQDQAEFKRDPILRGNLRILAPSAKAFGYQRRSEAERLMTASGFFVVPLLQRLAKQRMILGSSDPAITPDLRTELEALNRNFTAVVKRYALDAFLIAMHVTDDLWGQFRQFQWVSRMPFWSRRAIGHHLPQMLALFNEPSELAGYGPILGAEAGDGTLRPALVNGFIDNALAAVGACYDALGQIPDAFIELEARSRSRLSGQGEGPDTPGKTGCSVATPSRGTCRLRR